ncbi:MAG: carbohydrate ABC transporter permease [Caldiserica bacterium]|nr:MAG: carbohydrate ABC transporter permease [Caldisericota bacterium]
MNVYKAKEYSRRFLIYIFLITGLVAVLAPFVWMLSTSFKTHGAVFTMPPQWIPKPFTLENYKKLFSEINFLRHFLNSLIVAVSVTIFSLFINSLAGYAFAKYRFPGRDRIFALLLGAVMIPGQVTMIPVFLMLKKLGMLNSYLGLIIPCSASVFAIFLMRQFIYSIPDVLIESARLDGCSEFGIYWKIILPLCKPVLATLGIFTFMSSWNDFLWPLIVMIDEKMYTLPVALANLNGQHATEYALLMAGSVIVVLPVIIVFLIAQKHIIKGIATTGLKG